jgi:hypothetical protein
VAILAIVAGLMLTTAPVASAASEFPAGYEGYHTYAEVDAALDQVVADYGQGGSAIVRRSVIGQSFEGRDIWVLKVSDNVATDEDEPEVMAECGMHAREHITVEMCLYMIRLLTSNYAAATALGQQVSDIVNSREIWIIPTLNPDGAEYNIADGTFKNWRKNRQTNPGSAAMGIDLNRNFGFKWGCCGGSSSKPGSGTYRGRFPWEAVETRMLRDFVLSRRVDGRQQIRTVFNWHSYGARIYWPYGYTRTDVPSTMTADDHAAFVALGRSMGDLNGYQAHQGSDSYIYDGDFPAWGYGHQRMFVFTFEMYPPFGCKGCGGFKPPDEVIEAETTRNRTAVLYLLEQADCPWRAAGLGATNCGPLFDDFETARGWKVDPFGTDGATRGLFARGIPQGSSDANGSKQLARTSSGRAALVTGLARGGSATANDVDGGTTSALSPTVRLGAGAWTLRFRFTFAHNAAAGASDYLRVSVVENGNVVTPVWTVTGAPANRNAAWSTASVPLDAWAGQTVRLLVEANDGNSDNIVEAAVDDLRVFSTP